jgi:hypothetical protein
MIASLPNPLPSADGSDVEHPLWSVSPWAAGPVRMREALARLRGKHISSRDSPHLSCASSSSATASAISSPDASPRVRNDAPPMSAFPYEDETTAPLLSFLNSDSPSLDSYDELHLLSSPFASLDNTQIGLDEVMELKLWANDAADGRHGDHQHAGKRKREPLDVSHHAQNACPPPHIEPPKPAAPIEMNGTTLCHSSHHATPLGGDVLLSGMLRDKPRTPSAKPRGRHVLPTQKHVQGSSLVSEIRAR